MKKFLTAKFSILLLVTGIILLFIGLTIFIWNDFNFSISNKIDSNKIGQFGDFVGGLVGSIWALAGVILFYVALTEQRKDFSNNQKVLIAQTKSLEQQVKEFELQRVEFSETRKVFEIQKFETSFFNLLKFHNDLTNSLNIKITKTESSGDKKEKETFDFRGPRFFSKGNQLIESYLYSIDNIAIIKPEEELTYIINYIKKTYKVDKNTIDLIKIIYNENRVLKKEKIAFLVFYYQHETGLSKYMKLLITTVRLIDKMNKKIDEFSSDDYVEIIMAQLSFFEIRFIWIYLHVFKKEDDLEMLRKFQILPNQIKLFESKEYNS